MTRMNLASVIALRDTLKVAVDAWPADAGRAYVPVDSTVLDDLLADLIDFHTPSLANPPKLKKPKKR